jgi:hypothetical protein
MEESYLVSREEKAANAKDAIFQTSIDLSISTIRHVSLSQTKNVSFFVLIAIMTILDAF